MEDQYDDETSEDFDDVIDSQDDGDEEEDTDDEEDTSEDDDADEAEEEEEEDEDETKGEGLPEGVKRRFAKLTKARKSAEEKAAKLEKELNAVKNKYGETSPKTLMAIAQKHGILPSLLSAKNAKMIERADELEANISTLEDPLDDMNDRREDEIVIGGETYTRGQISKRLRQQKKEFAELRDDVKTTRKQLAARCEKLLKLGLEAEKAQKKGGKQNKKTREEEGLQPLAQRKRKLNGLDPESGSRSTPKSREELLALRRNLVAAVRRGD